MKTIQEWLDEIALRVLRNGFLSSYFIETLPKDDEIRNVICTINPWEAYYYAANVDKEPHDITRNACLPSAYCSYYYIVYIDKHLREDTRNACLTHPETAYYCAKDVEKCYSEDTYKVACQDLYWGTNYRQLVPNFPKTEGETK